MHFSIGMDIGLVGIKGVVMKGENIVAQVVKDTGVRPALAAKECYEQLLSDADISSDKIQAHGVSGWGSKTLSFDFDIEYLPDVVCLAKGAKWACPTSRMVVDVGAQTAKVARFDGNGSVKKYELSDKCASGTGRFLEIMSAALGLKVNNLGQIGQAASKLVEISSQCSVFAESEIISYVNTGEKTEDIVNGINYSIAKRVSTIIMRVGIQEDIIITGGVAKNDAVVRYIEEMVKVRFKDYGVDPQMIGAIGASLTAQQA
jgi:predicted CoA-substrate-specific enzyme activase